jgi:hypothetical protein
MRTDRSNTRSRSRRAARLGLTAGALVAAWIATGAPIHLGMIEDLVNGMVP